MIACHQQTFAHYISLFIWWTNIIAGEASETSHIFLIEYISIDDTDAEMSE